MLIDDGDGFKHTIQQKRSLKARFEDDLGSRNREKAKLALITASHCQTVVDTCCGWHLPQNRLILKIAAANVSPHQSSSQRVYDIPVWLLQSRGQRKVWVGRRWCSSCWTLYLFNFASFLFATRSWWNIFFFFKKRKNWLHKGQWRSHSCLRPLESDWLTVINHSQQCLNPIGRQSCTSQQCCSLIGRQMGGVGQRLQCAN